MNSLSPDKTPGRVAVWLGLGSNLEDPAGKVLDAFKRLSDEVLEDAVISSLYVTEPQDVEHQPEFVNAACRGYYVLSPFSLLKKISRIERELGRSRGNEQRRGPRTIDIDILLFGDYAVRAGTETDGEGRWLRIPHERLKQRRFALVPLLELNPDIADPVSGIKYAEIEKSLAGQGIYSFDTVSYIKSHGAKTGG